MRRAKFAGFLPLGSADAYGKISLGRLNQTEDRGFDAWAIHLIPVRCYHQSMANRMPPEVLEYLRSMGKKFGKLGGKTSAKNMTAAERLARARKASMAAAEQRTAKRLAREGLKRDRHAARRKRSGRAT
jgi:hypothetical protein